MDSLPKEEGKGVTGRERTAWSTAGGSLPEEGREETGRDGFNVLNANQLEVHRVLEKKKD